MIFGSSVVESEVNEYYGLEKNLSHLYGYRNTIIIYSSTQFDTNYAFIFIPFSLYVVI